MARVTTVGGMYRVLEWLMWICFINILWVLFSIVGLLVFGIFPATAAAFAAMRHLFMKGVGKGLFKLFLTTFKQEFFKANGIGFLFVIAGYIIYLDFLFVKSVSGIMFYALQTGLIIIALIYLVALLYIMPVFVHYRLKFFQYFKHAVLIGIFSPVWTILMIVGLVIIYYLIRFVPGLIPFVTVGLATFNLMGIALAAFQGMEMKQQDVKSPKG